MYVKYIYVYIYICTYNDGDCFYYHSWRNNVVMVIAFGILSY